MKIQIILKNYKKNKMNIKLDLQINSKLIFEIKNVLCNLINKFSIFKLYTVR